MRRRRARLILCPVPARSLEIVVSVQVDGEEISGEARCGAASRPFLGWLGLIGVLDTLLDAIPDESAGAAPETAHPTTQQQGDQP
jgi:hypothetical protein